MKRIVIAGVCLSVLLISFKSKGQNASSAKLSLKQCIETGLANSFDVEQRRLLADGDKASLLQSKMNLLPDLNASVGHSWSQGRGIDPYTNAFVTQSFNSSSYNVSSNVVLFNGFAVQNSIKRASLSYQASTMEWQQAKDNLTINIILAYLQVLSNTDQLERAKNQLSVSAKQLERLEVMNKEGAIRPVDLSDMKGLYASDQLSILNAENSLSLSKVTLCNRMNVPYDPGMTLEKIDMGSFADKYDNDPGVIYETALKQLAVVKAVDLRRQSADKNVKAARGLLFPTLSFGGGASTRYVSGTTQSQYVNTVYASTSDSAIVSGVKYPVYRYRDNFSAPVKIGYVSQLDNNLNTYYGFNLSIPIFNSLQRRTLLKQAKNTLKIAELVVKTTRTQLNQDINAAYINMSGASERYKTLQEQTAAFADSLRTSEIFLQQGVINSYQYIIAKNNLDQANINLIIAKYDYMLRSKILDYYQGKQLW